MECGMAGLTKLEMIFHSAAAHSGTSEEVHEV
jgi:hypothetical protein